jgi:dUTP pyrophosphatase
MKPILYHLGEPAGNFELTFSRWSRGAAGFDLHANIATERDIGPGMRWVVRTGLSIAVPYWAEAQVRPRSSMVRDWGVVAQLGTIDSDYRGEISAVLINHGQQARTIVPGERIAQLVLAPVLPEFYEVVAQSDVAHVRRFLDVRRVSTVEELGTTDRGVKGYGSTGR